jgi:hypothetical protein
MKPRLATGAAIAVQTGMFSDVLESPFKFVERNLLRVPVDKEGIIGFPRSRIVATRVFGKNPNRIRSQRDQTAFEELRVSDRKDGVGKIDIPDRQRQCL